MVDDGSQDNTLEVISVIPDPRIQVIQGNHAGAKAARNRGLHHSSGEYVSFLDADDLWTPNKLHAQFQALQKHPEAAVAYSWTTGLTNRETTCGRAVISASAVMYWRNC